MSETIINLAVEAVADLINDLGLFADIYRGALGTGNGLCCEVGPTRPEAVYLDKNKYIPIDLTINGKHTELSVLTEAMNSIHQYLTMLRSYPSGTSWQIVDITTATEPQVIDRESEGAWLMTSALYVKVETKL